MSAVGPAGDHFVAQFQHIDQDMRLTKYPKELALLDRSGALLSRTELPDLITTTSGLAVASDGVGSTLLVHDGRASWLRDGVEETRIELTGPAAVTFANDTYWLAIASAPRQLLHYDTQGNRIESVVVPDERGVSGVAESPSLAIDPLGTGVAVGWTMTYDTEDAFVVSAVTSGTVLGIELASARGSWSSTVAMRDGTIAMLFGSPSGPTLARLAPDGQITTTLIELAGACDSLVGTVSGYVAICESGSSGPPDVVYLDPLGNVVRVVEDASKTWLVATRGAALAINNPDDGSLETYVLDAEIAVPTQVLDGSSSVSVEDDSLGCSASKSPSGLAGLLGLLLLARRRRRR